MLTRAWIPFLRPSARTAGFLLLALAAGCPNAPLPPLEVPEGCQPLASEHHCLLPYPSDFFLREGRVAIPDAALPWIHDSTGPVEPFDPFALHPAGGFSPVSPILALFSEGVDPSDLVFHTGDLARSTRAESPTLLVGADTGEAVAHFAELDAMTDEPAKRALLLRVLKPLSWGHRYVVGIHGLRRPDGTPIPPPEGFRRLRDGQADGDPNLRPLVSEYEEVIFPALEGVGVARGELILAWSFTVRSENDAIGDMLAVRQAAMAIFEATPPKVLDVREVSDARPEVARHLEVELAVPLFLESTEPGASLYRDAEGRPAQNGVATARVSVLVPTSVVEGAMPGRALQYGHGFFGSRQEIVDHEVHAPFIDAYGFVSFATDWWGMSNVDRGLVAADILQDTSRTLRFGDRVHQAMVNQIALSYAIGTTLAEEPLLQAGGRPVYDPSHVYFYGISQGHILGGTYLALAPRVERGVLEVGGGAFSFMMFRARPFGLFLVFVSEVLPDPLDQQIFAALAQSSFDRFDSASYAGHVLADALPGGPTARRVLMHAGRGDAEVPVLAARLHARALGLALMTPSVETPIYGLPEVESPYDGSAYVEYDFGLPDPLPGTEARIPEEDTEVHEGIRRLEVTQSRVDRFLRPDGKIERLCDGPCDPE